MGSPIFILDDDEANRQVLELVFEEKGWEVVAIAQTEELYQRLEGETPAVLLLDVWILGVNSSEIIKQLKMHQATQHVPIVMISAGPDLREQAARAGADDYVEKPFDIDQLIEKVHQFLPHSLT